MEIEADAHVSAPTVCFLRCLYGDEADAPCKRSYRVCFLRCLYGD